MISNTYGAQAQLEFLEGALPERIKDRMSMVKKTPEQLWEQLDEMFGDPRVMVNEAMSDLHSLDHKKLGNSFISKFSATLNDTEKLLEANGNADHLSHPREVVQLQDMLPRNEKLEYVRRKKNYVGSDYQKLKAFLSERRLEEEELRKIGSGSNSEDSSASKVCGYCSKPGHVLADCRKRKRELGSGGGNPANLNTGPKCFSCKEVGHVKRNCPVANKKDKDDKDAASKQDVQSNHLRTADCPRCKKASGAQVTCAGCGKSGQGLGHCLAHCSKYIAENVAGKASMILKGKGCVICLHPKHEADSCFSKDKANSVCGIDGCKSHHHPTLHGAKDAQIASCNMTKVKGTTFSSYRNPEDVASKFEKVCSLKTKSGALEDEHEFVARWTKARRREELEEVVKKLGDPMLFS